MVRITINDVPEDVRTGLVQRAALQGQSMEDFLRRELERLAPPPSRSALLQSVQRRKEAARTRVEPSSILRVRDMDRA